MLVGTSKLNLCLSTTQKTQECSRKIMCFEMTSDTELTLRDFWKNHFNILHCLRIIVKAWGEVSFRTLNSVWKNLWQDCVAARDFEGFHTEHVVVDDIVSLGKSMGLDVDSDDVEELVEDHRNELNTEELQELHREQQEEVVEELSSSEKESSKGSISTAEIKELCYHRLNEAALLWMCCVLRHCF
ncbi:uncharacterized protein LOC143022170 [Oratosquilla oratoria]|uniref:uncharacterized protein LOC143022170 n=1 Tax=Oratosquilla oratoria TaxID=337810 RepID=UPI003F75AD6E